MGRPRKTLNLHIAQGTLRPDRHSDRGFEAAVGIGQPGGMGIPPDYLGRWGIIEWDRLTNHPQYSQILTEMDRGALEHYCWLHNRLKAEMCGEEEILGGALSTTEKQLLNTLRMQFGLTPPSRSKISMPIAKPESKWSKYRTASGQ